MRYRLFFLATLAVAAGCDGGSSGRGESCRARNDCASGLRCINNICALNDFSIEPTALSCDLIECVADGDCCPEPPPSCTSLERDCTAGDTFACDEFDRSCRCRRSCQESRCVFSCATDPDCGFGSTCVAGLCVECSSDGECGGDRVCRVGQCVSACSSNSDCPYFHTCTGGECVETGCTTDRECIAATSNPRATCTEGECSAPCESDAQCNVSGYSFQACTDGQCVYVGCETDEECRIFLRITPGSMSSAVCR